MKRTNRSYPSRALVVFLAVMMVLTMMPSGMWGILRPLGLTHQA